ncbi:MAG: hypothetical protein AAGN66_17820 [Acidobacteriota bacterium]
MALQTRRSAMPVLGRRLAAREALAADLRPTRVVGRAADGAKVELPLDGTCQRRGDTGAEAIDQVYAAPSNWSPGNVGTLGGLTATAGGGPMRLDRMDPPFIYRGEAQTVLLRGAGFVPGMQFEPLLLDAETRHPGLALGAARYVDPNTYELDVTSAPDAEIVFHAPVSYGLATPAIQTPGQPTQLRFVQPRIYSSVIGGARRYWAYKGIGGTLYRWALNADGEVLGLGDEGSFAASDWYASRASVVHTDPEGIVGDGSLLWVPLDGSALHLADFEGRTDHRYSPPSGRQVSPAAMIDGQVYWLEWEPGVSATTTITVRRARADFDTPETRGAYALPGSGTPEWLFCESALYTATRVALTLRLRVGEVIERRIAYLNLADGSGSHATAATFGVGVPCAGGSLSGPVFWDGTAGGGEGGGGPTGWVPGSWFGSYSITEGWADASGTVAVGYDFGRQRIYEADFANAGASPDRVADVMPHPTHGVADHIAAAGDLS